MPQARLRTVAVKCPTHAETATTLRAHRAGASPALVPNRQDWALADVQRR